MKLILTFKNLMTGQRIFTVRGERLIILKFLCRHPECEDCAFFLKDEKAEPIQVYKSVIEEQNWYLYDETDEVWIYIYDAMIDYCSSKISQILERRNKLRKK